jgi:hypothetical protein
VAPTANAVKPPQARNAVGVEGAGPHIRVVISGRDVLNMDPRRMAAIKDKPPKGHVCLQNHGAKIEFRNVRTEAKKAMADK